MQKKSDPHIFSGMQRDLSISKQKAESLYDAKNLRFTARDGDTMLSITNEKGTTQLKEIIEGSESRPYVALQGVYLGHCVVDNYIVVFTHNSDSSSNPDYIYKIIPTTDEFVTVIELYHGNLNFDEEHLIETLGIYENDNIQKVYWTDGKNEPRYILTGEYNHIQTKDVNHPNADNQFDFIANLDLQEVVTIERREGSGSFAPGTIQYAFTYYNKYGRQSNIFYTTPIHYISYPERGASPEDVVANSFEINISNLQTTDFDYLRIYSIHRTSLNATPTVKRVIDIELSTVVNNTTLFVDNGIVGDTIDPTELLYMGGEDIIAQTITQKDNTLFFGNLEITRKAIPAEYKNLITAVNKTEEQILQSLSPIEGLEEQPLKVCDISNDYYKYANTLNWSHPGFKNREHYRLGVQFQHKSGRWSEPVFIGDYTFEGKHNDNLNNPRLDINTVAGVTTAKVYTPKLTVTIPTVYTKDGVVKNLTSDDYIKARPVVVFPTIDDRLVLTQGILSPTVFSKSNRNNSSPFAQSSWFFRPHLPRVANDSGLNCIPRVLSTNSEGTYIAFEHLESLAGAENANDGNKQNKAVEIQGSRYPIELESNGSNVTIKEVNPPDDKQFFVDQSIVTMHSPDIEWDNNFNFLDYTDWKLNIVGAAIVTSVCSDLDIQVSTPQNLDTQGFIRKRYNTSSSYYAGGCLAAALAWEDCMVATEFKDNATKYYLHDNRNVASGNNNPYTNAIVRLKYLIYPWHRSGSLNNDENRGDNSARTAVLKRKVLSNLKFCNNNKFFKYSTSDAFQGSMDITQIQLFNADYVSLLKLPLKNNTFKNSNISYYGNVDTLLSGNNARIMINREDSIDNISDIATTFLGSSVSVNTKRDNILFSGDTPVRMKYKSSRHLVFGLAPNADKSTNILPRVFDVHDQDGVYGTDKMFWVKENYDSSSAYKNAVIDVMVFDNLSTAISLTNEIYAIAQDDILVLLDSGSPRLVKANVENNQLSTVTNIATEEGKYYVGPYYESAKDCDETLVFIQDDNSSTNYGLVASSMADVINATTETEDGITLNPFYVNQPLIPNSSLQDNGVNAISNAYFLLGELYRDADPNFPYFGGKSDDATKSNMWIPAGEPVEISGNTIDLYFTQGDTWYSRYDCLKTYPFTQEDENSIVEIASFLCESRINADGRYDRNRGQMSNINMSNINFNLLNLVYSNQNNFFNYKILDDDFYTLNKFSNQITWSKEKQNGADVDLWTNITMANTFDLDGTMGPINALRTWKDTIYCFQDNAISIISFNPRVQIPTSDGVPIEISNSYKLEGKVYISDSIGCSNKWTIAITPSGIYFIDPNSKELYNLAGNQLTSVSGSHGFSNWFKSNIFTNTFYDKNRNDLYVLNDEECIVYSELLGQFTSFMDYNATPSMFNINDKFYAFRNGSSVSMYSLFTGDYNYFFDSYKDYWFEFISNQDSVLDKIFSTIDMRVDFTDYSEEEPVINHNDFFDVMRVSNEYQDTSTVPIDAKKKFRIWRVQIPRDKDDELERIRNTWARISFTKRNTGNERMELHDLSVQYFI